jgi:hypothetical protein
MGRFALTGLPSGKVSLRAELIGYHPEKIQVEIEKQTGYAAAWGLTEASIELCINIVDPRSVSVGVRDVLTSRPPEGEVILELSEGGFRDRVTAAAAPRDSLLRISSSGWRDGTYQVEVRAEGYRPWKADSVRVGSGGACNNLQPRYFSVWLLPN